MRSIYFLVFLFAITASGCVGHPSSNRGTMPKYPILSPEAEWIREGEPIEFGQTKWYPTDQIEILRDSEVFLLGDYGQVQFFVEKADIKPYNRLYTKFGRNQFRVFRPEIQK